MPRIVRSGAFLCGGRKLLRFHTFKRHIQLNIVGRWAQVHLLAEVLAIEAGGAFKTGTVAAPWIFAFTQEGGLDNDRLGHAVQGQVAGHVGSDLARSIFTGGLTLVETNLASANLPTSRKSLLEMCLSRSAWLVNTLAVRTLNSILLSSGLAASKLNLPSRSLNVPVMKL